MNLAHSVVRHSILLSLLFLSACQMPVKQARSTSGVKLPTAEVPAATPEVVPAATTETPINIVEAQAIDSPASADYPTTRTGEAVFSRLNNSFSGPICNDSPAIAQWKKRYAGNSKAFSNHLSEILPLLDYVSLEVERRKLPAEFALIPIIESWYKPNAVGSGGPSGLWQMIGSTAKNHGVKIQAGYDGRFSVVDSTDAALSYLGKLQGMFKDWQRAVMGYNAGEFRILRAIRTSGDHSEGQDHWPQGLSPITYAYISKLQALSCLISQPEKHNLSLPTSTEFAPLAAILVDANFNTLDTIAKRYEIDTDILQLNNPAYQRGRIAPQAPRRILMPARLASIQLESSIDQVAQNSETDTSDETATPKLQTNRGSHEIKNGDTLWSIAKRYGISIAKLRKLNRLGLKPVLRVGQTLKLAP